MGTLLIGDSDGLAQVNAETGVSREDSSELRGRFCTSTILDGPSKTGLKMDKGACTAFCAADQRWSSLARQVGSFRVGDSAPHYGATSVRGLFITCDCPAKVVLQCSP